MKKIFILEDNPERNKIFKRDLSVNNDIVIATTVKEARRLFTKNSNYDILMLDHDLGGRQYVSSQEEETGYQFIRWLAENYDIRDYYVVVHSLNPSGATNMMKYVAHGERIPFTNLIDVLKIIK